MAEYRGVDGVARKIVKEYRGVDGVAREVVKAYRGVDGVARQYFNTSPVEITKYAYGGNDTDISSYSIIGGLGTVNLSLKTVRGGDSSSDKIGAHMGISATKRDGDWSNALVNFTLDQTGYDPGTGTIEITFVDASGSSLGVQQLSNDATRAFNCPAGTKKIRFSIWNRYEKTTSLSVTNFKINGELLDWTI